VAHREIEHADRHEELIRRLAEKRLAGEEKQQAERYLLECVDCLEEFNEYRRIWHAMTRRENIERWGEHLQRTHPGKYAVYRQAMEQARAKVAEADARAAGTGGYAWAALWNWRNLAVGLAVLLLTAVSAGGYKLAVLRNALRHEQASAQALRAEIEQVKGQEIAALRQKVDALSQQKEDDARQIRRLADRSAKYEKPSTKTVALLTLTLGPARSVDPSGLQEKPQRIKWPKGKPSAHFYIQVSQDKEYPTYRLVLADSRGNLMHEEDDVQKDRNDRFSLLVGREFLQDGDYTLAIYGMEGQRPRLVSEGRFRLSQGN